MPSPGIRRRKAKAGEAASAWLLLLPAIVLIAVFYLIPIVENIRLSFTNYSVYHVANYSYIGFENYKTIFGENIAGLAGVTAWTFSFAAGVVVTSFFLGLALAILLNNHRITLRKIHRTIFVIPWVLPSVITLLLWRGMLNTSDGFFNKIISGIGLGAMPWLTDPVLARVSVILVIVWFSFPYMMVVALSFLQSIPKDLYEAARIDGARPFQSFLAITLPGVFRGMAPVLVLAFIMQFNQFGVYLITSGGPSSQTLGAPGATDLLLTYVYGTAFKTFRYSLAAAYSVIIFVFVAIFALVNVRLSERVYRE